jgi:serine O-acetyltransferase
MKFREALTLAYEDRRTNHDNLSSKVIFTTYRLGCYFMNKRARAGRVGRVLWRLLLEPSHRLHLVMTMLAGCEVPYAARIGRRMRIVHGWHGIFLSVWASIGDDVVMLQHVTVGSNNHTSGTPGAPTIEKGVFIGAGAKIIGPVRIGEGARVGANAIVVTDVPAFATAISPKALVREATGPRAQINRDMPAHDVPSSGARFASGIEAKPGDRAPAASGGTA